MKASDWISVEDKLPELHCDAGGFKFSREVLLCLGDDEILTASLICDKSDNTKFWCASRGGTHNLEECTHWQPIVFPKEEKK